MSTQASKLISILSDPLRLSLEDFVKDADTQTSIAFLSIELWSRLAVEQVLDLDVKLWALFDDSNDENWGSVETKWAEILTRHQKNAERILKRRSVLLELDNSQTTEDHEREYSELWIELEGVTQALLDEINTSLDWIVEWFKDTPQYFEF